MKSSAPAVRAAASCSAALAAGLPMPMLLATVSSNTIGSWKTNATLSRTQSTLRAARSVSSSSTRPAVGRMNPGSV